jgi:hypothetical protein
MRSKLRHSFMIISSACCLVTFTAGLFYPHVFKSSNYSATLCVEPVSDEEWPGQKQGLVGCGLDPSMGTAGWVEANRDYLRHYPRYAKTLKESWTHLPKEVWKGIVPE